MNKKCPNCNVINFLNAENCIRCGESLNDVEAVLNRNVSGCEKPRKSFGAKILRRAAVCVAVCIAVLACFYLSLLFTSKSLAYEEKQTVKRAIGILESKGFDREVFLLRHVTSFRANDNWLNAST